MNMAIEHKGFYGDKLALIVGDKLAVILRDTFGMCAARNL